MTYKQYITIGLVGVVVASVPVFAQQGTTANLPTSPNGIRAQHIPGRADYYRQDLYHNWGREDWQRLDDYLRWVAETILSRPVHDRDDRGDRYPGRGYGDRDRHWDDIKRYLHLSPRQERALLIQRQEFHRRMDKLNRYIYELRHELGEEMQRPVIRRNRVEDIHRHIKQLVVRREDLRFERLVEVREILSAEQYRKLVRLMDERKDKAEYKNGPDRNPGRRR